MTATVNATAQNTEAASNTTPHGGNGEVSAMTKAQEYVTRVQQLRDSGLQQSDAFKKVAEENGVTVSTVRGAVYRAGGTRSNGTSRTTKKPPADPTEQAAQMFRDAIDRIDTDLQALKERADEARNEYEEAKKTADARRKAYEAKIKAITS